MLLFTAVASVLTCAPWLWDQIVKLVDKYQDSFLNWLPMISFTKLMVTLFFLGHWLGCSYFYFATPEWRTDDETYLIESESVRPVR